jgi:hypothetical protein
MKLFIAKEQRANNSFLLRLQAGSAVKCSADKQARQAILSGCAAGFLRMLPPLSASGVSDLETQGAVVGTDSACENAFGHAGRFIVLAINGFLLLLSPVSGQ